MNSLTPQTGSEHTTRTFRKKKGYAVKFYIFFDGLSPKQDGK